MRIVNLASLCMAMVLLLLPIAACAPAPGTAPGTAGATLEQPAAEVPPEPEMPMAPPPKTCDPANPQLSPVQIISDPTPSQEVDQIYSMRATYTNPELGQEFLFTASSQQPEELRKFLEEMKVCYEVLDSELPDVGGEQPDITPEEDSKVATEFLLANPYNILFEFQVSKSDVDPKNLVAIHFVVDPTLDNDRVDDFAAKCSYSASISVRVSNNNAQAQLYRIGGLWDTTDLAVPGDPSSTVWHNNGAIRTTYDARVIGPSGTRYTVTGTWTKSGNSISFNVCP